MRQTSSLFTFNAEKSKVLSFLSSESVSRWNKSHFAEHKTNWSLETKFRKYFKISLHFCPTFASKTQPPLSDIVSTSSTVGDKKKLNIRYILSF